MLAKPSVDQVLMKARSHSKKGEFLKALEIYQGVLKTFPKNIRAQEGLIVLKKSKQHNTTQTPSKETVNKLIKYYQEARYDDIEKLARSLIEEFPKHLLSWKMLGAALYKSRKKYEALEAMLKTVELNSDDAEAHNNLGVIYQELNKFKEAEISYRQALVIKPNYAQAFNHLGNTLAVQSMSHPETIKKLRRLEEAEAYYKKALIIKHDYFEAHYNLGILFKYLNRLEEAEASYRKAISYKHGFALAHNNLGNTLKELGKLKDAELNYEQALIFKPDLIQAHYNKNFCLNYSSLLSQNLIYQEHLEFEKKFGGLEVRTSLNLPFKKKPGDKLRIGYVSGDFKKHSVAYFFENLLEHHNYNIVEIFCYYNDNFIDETTKRLMSFSNHWRSIYEISDQDTVDLIKNDRIEILVDLSGYTAKNRLLVFAQKPSPIQVTWLGYPNTTGLSAIDYRITDIIADPIGAADKLHSETLLRLPNSFLCYKGDKTVNLNVNLPQKNNGYITFGSFNNLLKVTPEVIKTWSKILHAVPGSKLILKDFRLKHNSNDYKALFKLEGITEDRIECLGRLPNMTDHLKLYNKIDIGLDPFPYNGTTTTCEALWMGVPVVTLLGNNHAGRVGTSILNNIGLKDFIAQDINDYINFTTKIAHNPKFLKKTRKNLRERMKTSTLCDGTLFAKDIENAYQDMWRKFTNDSVYDFVN